MSLSTNPQWLEAHAGITNELLSDSDRIIVRSLLRKALQDLERLEQQITETTNSTDPRLMKLANDISTRISQFRIAIAPHQTLPAELLAEVFMQCLQGAVVDIPIPAGHKLPWRLGHICSRWRNVALSEPRLWNQIAFTCDPQKHTSIPPALQEALKRSGQGPLIFGIFCPLGMIGDSSIILDLIERYAHRCIEIHLMIPERQMKAFLTNPCISFESLEAAVLVFSNPYSEDIAHPFLQEARVFESASSLRRLTFHAAWGSNNVILTLDDPHIPWRQLTHIELLTFSVLPSTAHALFNMCPSMQDCYLKLHAREEMATNLPIPNAPIYITLRYLCRLELQSPDPTHIFETLRPLILPALTNFTQVFEFYVPTISFAPLISLIHRSRCRLTRLATTRPITSQSGITDSSDTDMEALVELLPHVTTFYDFGFVVPVSALQRIRDGELLPSVRSFRFTFNGVAAFALYVDILEARWLNEVNGGPVLEEASADDWVPCRFEDGIEKEIIRLREIQKRLNMEHRKAGVPSKEQLNIEFPL